MQYADRAEAGHRLGSSLDHLRGSEPVVLGLPRGGVPVAKTLADDVGGDLDILIVRKLGVPWQRELAFGALGEGGVRVLNDDVIAGSRLSATDIAATEAAEGAELEHRSSALRGGRQPVDTAGRVVIVVDDGMATGATAAAACTVARARSPKWLVLAVPVASHEAMRRLRALADEVVCPHVPDDLGGVGAAYVDFHQLSDDEVIALLD